MTGREPDPPDRPNQPGRPAHDAAHWDARYAAQSDLLTTPNPTVLAALEPLTPGRALDLGAGRGRHAHWLADRGWTVTAVDFSAVGVALARTPADDRRTPIRWVVADIHAWAPDPADPPYDLVLCAFVTLSPGDFARVRAWLGPGGRLVVVGHAAGAGHGPANPAYRYSAADLAAAATGLTIERLAAHDGSLTLIARAVSRPGSPAGRRG